MSALSERPGIGRCVAGAILGMGRAIVETYRLGGRAVKAAPLVLAIAIVPEFLQHITEIHLGMFVSVEQFRALANDPLRWGFGYAKVAGFVIAILAVARFWSVGSMRRTLLVPPMTIVRVVAGMVVGLVAAWPFMWLGKQGISPAINVPLQIVSTVIQGGFWIYVVGALIEDPLATPRRAMTSLLPAGIVLSVLAAVAFGPAQALHMANHKLAMGQPSAIMWALMVFDALWVGLFAALVGSALFVGVKTGLTWRGWTVSPGDLDAAVNQVEDTPLQMARTT